MLTPCPLFLCLLTLCFSVLSSHPLFLCVIFSPSVSLCYFLTLFVVCVIFSPCFSLVSPQPLSLSGLHYVHVVHGWMSTVLLTFDCWQHFCGSCWRCLMCALVTVLGLRADCVVFTQLRLSPFLMLALLTDKCVHANCTVDCSWYLSHWLL